MSDAMFIDERAEANALGAVLVKTECLYQLAAIVRPEDFGTDASRLTYAAMLELAEAGAPVDTYTVQRKLEEQGNWKRIGGYTWLGSLTDTNPVVASIAHYAEVIREGSRRRQFGKLLTLGEQMLMDQSEQTEDCFGVVLEGISRIQANTAKAEASTIADVMPGVMDELAAQRSRAGGTVGLSTGLAALDSSTTGIRPSELWVVGALPGRGKTAFGLQVAVEAAKAGKPALVFSLEMTKEQLVRRFLALESGVSAFKIREPLWINATDWGKLEQAKNQVHDWPLWIDDASSLTTRELTARARFYRRRYKIELFVVDYLRLVDGPGRELRERVGAVANSLRQLAKEEKVAVVALSQLARPRDRDINARPSMLDLKESGDVEAHANTVLLLYQPVEKDGRPTGEDEIILGKQRNGPLGSIPVVFDKKTLSFQARETGAKA